MYFKIPIGSSLYDNIKAVVDKCKDADAKALELSKSLGYDEYAGGQYALAGGIAAFHIPSGKKPEGWKQVGESYQNFFFPKAIRQNKNILDKIYALPKVDSDEMKKVLKWNTQCISSNGGLRFISCPKVVAGKKYFLVNTFEGTTYKPLKNMVEIYEKEFLKLEEKAKKEVA